MVAGVSFSSTNSVVSALRLVGLTFMSRLAGQRWMEGKIDLSSSGTGPSIDHGAYSTLTELILLKRNVKLLMLHFFGLEVPECCLWISNKGKPPFSLCHLINESSVLLATPRGQGRGRTVIPGFAVRYISIMLPSQTRHLVCQSQTVVLPSPLPIFLHMRWRAEHSI